MALSSKTGYSMTVSIDDGTGSTCSVVLSDSVIQSHVGIPAKEAKGLRRTEAGASSVVQKLTDFYTKLDFWKKGAREFKLQRQEADGTIHWLWAS